MSITHTHIRTHWPVVGRASFWAAKPLPGLHTCVHVQTYASRKWHTYISATRAYSDINVLCFVYVRKWCRILHILLLWAVVGPQTHHSMPRWYCLGIKLYDRQSNTLLYKHWLGAVQSLWHTAWYTDTCDLSILHTFGTANQGKAQPWPKCPYSRATL